MTIREASISDGSAVAELTRQLGYSIDSESTSGRLERLKGKDDHLILVAVAVLILSSAIIYFSRRIRSFRRPVK